MKKYLNYIKLFSFLLVTVVFVLYALKWHVVCKEERESKIYITDYISEVGSAEFHNFITDKRDIVIYFGISNNNDCRNLEKQLKKVIIKNQLGEEIVYLNVNDLQAENFSRQLDLLYNDVSLRKQGRYLNQVPALGVYENAVLVDFLIGINASKNKIVKFLKKHEIIEEV